MILLMIMMIIDEMICVERRTQKKIMSHDDDDDHEDDDDVLIMMMIVIYFRSLFSHKCDFLQLRPIVLFFFMRKDSTVIYIEGDEGLSRSQNDKTSDI